MTPALLSLLLAAAPAPPQVPADAPRAALLDSGKVLFKSCGMCHGQNGRGGRGPTLANSDYVQADRERLIRTVLLGIKDSIRVNGVRWKTGEMVGWAETFNDFQIAAVLTWIRAGLNDSTVASCTAEDVDAGTWAACEKRARTRADLDADSIAVGEVTRVREALGLPPAQR